jgi:hypothetical protein
MSLVLGVDFGTLSVRVSVFDQQAGRLSFGNCAVLRLFVRTNGVLPTPRRLAAVA